MRSLKEINSDFQAKFNDEKSLDEYFDKMDTIKENSETVVQEFRKLFIPYKMTEIEQAAYIYEILNEHPTNLQCFFRNFIVPLIMHVAGDNYKVDMRMQDTKELCQALAKILENTGLSYI